MERRTSFLTGCSLAILAAALMWVPPRESVVNSADSRAKTILARASPGAGQLRARPDSSKGLSAPLLSPHPADSPEHGSWISDRCEALEGLGWMDDEDSLKSILAELKNPEPEIREAALGAVAVFGSKEAIPFLEGFAADTGDPAEKLALRKTAENLKIPTATEYFARKKSERTGGE
jgi:hypothetical protein